MALFDDTLYRDVSFYEFKWPRISLFAQGVSLTGYAFLSYFYNAITALFVYLITYYKLQRNYNGTAPFFFCHLKYLRNLLPLFQETQKAARSNLLRHVNNYLVKLRFK